MTIPKPSFESSEPIGVARTVSSSYEDGAHLRGTQYARRLRRFVLVYDRNLTAAGLADLQSAFNTAKGGAGTTTYTPFQETSARTVQFVGNSLSYKVNSGNSFSATVTLEEVPTT